MLSILHIFIIVAVTAIALGGVKQLFRPTLRKSLHPTPSRPRSYSFPTPPFPNPVDSFIADSSDDWCSQSFGIRDMVVSHPESGELDRNTGYMKSGGGYGEELVCTGSLLNAYVVSYMAVGGPGAQYVQVQTLPPSQAVNQEDFESTSLHYQAWDGTNFIESERPLVASGGYYWWRRNITLEGDLEAYGLEYSSAGKFIFFAKPYLYSGSGSRPGFYVYAFIERKYVQVTGGTCESNGMRSITDYDVCHKAFHALGWTDFQYPYSTSHNIPTVVDGCSYETEYKLLLFNEKGSCNPAQPNAICSCQKTHKCACLL